MAASLTRPEREVLELIVTGRSNSEIAARLSIAPSRSSLTSTASSAGSTCRAERKPWRWLTAGRAPDTAAIGTRVRLLGRRIDQLAAPPYDKEILMTHAATNIGRHPPGHSNFPVRLWIALVAGGRGVRLACSVSCLSSSLCR